MVKFYCAYLVISQFIVHFLLADNNLVILHYYTTICFSHLQADVVKYGIQIPNRVFVGGVAFDVS